MEFHLQRRIEQHGFAFHLINIRLQFIDFMRPVLCHNKQRLWRNFLYVFDPLFIKPRRNMFDRIKTKTVALCLFHHPARPVFNLFRHGMIAEIDILTHQIIEITEFIINLIVPAFAGVVVNNFKYAIFIRIFDMVDTAKTFEIPDKLRVLPGTGGEGVTRPAFALNDFFVNLRTVISIYTLHANSFFFIRAHFVVDYHVQQHRNVITFQSINGGQQLCFIAIFSRDAAFLIKLA